jgi:hypothetical protein
MIRAVHALSRQDRKKARRSRAWLNGEEVTSRCFYADDRRGIVGLYRLNADGEKYLEDPRTHEPLTGGVRVYVRSGTGYAPTSAPPRVAVEWRHGQVTIGRAA